MSFELLKSGAKARESLTDRPNLTIGAFILPDPKERLDSVLSPSEKRLRRVVLPINTLAFSRDQICRLFVDVVSSYHPGQVNQSLLSSDSTTKIEVKRALCELSVTEYRDASKVLVADRFLIETKSPLNLVTLHIFSCPAI